MKVVPKKQLGQHFLVDENILGVIERLAELQPDDVVLEIGPGLGVLTGYLADRVAHVHAVEIDRVARAVSSGHPADDAPLGGRARARPRRARAAGRQARREPALQRRDADRRREPRPPPGRRAVVRDGAARGRRPVLRVSENEGLRRGLRPRPARGRADRASTRCRARCSARGRTSSPRSSRSAASRPASTRPSSDSSRRRSRTGARRSRTRSRSRASRAAIVPQPRSTRSVGEPAPAPRSSSRPSSSPSQPRSHDQREAPAKINLALVVGGTRPDGLHEVATILQRIDLCDTVSLEPAAELSVEGFADDTIVRRALEAVAAAQRSRAQLARPDREADPGGGRARRGQHRRGDRDQAGVRAPRRSRRRDPISRRSPRPRRRRPVLPRAGARSSAPATGTTLEPLDLPQDYTVLLVMPHGDSKPSTAEIYSRFDRDEGFDGSPRTRARGRARRPRRRSGGPSAERPRALAAGGPAALPRRVPGRRQRGRAGRVRPLPQIGPPRRPPPARSRSSERPGSRPLRGSVFPAMATDAAGVLDKPESRPGRYLREHKLRLIALDRRDRGDAGASRRASRNWRALRPRDRRDRLVRRDGPQVHLADRPPHLPGSSLRRRRSPSHPGAAPRRSSGSRSPRSCVAVIAGLVLLFAERDKL